MTGSGISNIEYRTPNIEVEDPNRQKKIINIQCSILIRDSVTN